MALRAEVVILGGGAAGCSTAYHLGKLGISSLLVEKDAIASQASGKAWGVTTPASAALLQEPVLMPGHLHHCLSLFDESFRLFPQLAVELKVEGGVDIEYGRLPILLAVFRESSEKTLKERMVELRSQGFELDWLDRDDLKARFPGIIPEARGALMTPGGQVEPYQYVLALAQAAEAKGATIKQGQAVGFRTQKNRVSGVKLSSGTEIEGEAFVIAMGPWSKFATSWLGKEIPLRVIREQCLRVEVPWRLPPYALQSSRVAIIPKVNGSVVLGEGGSREDEVDFDDSTTEKTKMAMTDSALGLVPRLKEARLVEHRAGLQGWPPYGLPILGRLPGWDNVYVATGFGTIGITLSPAVGRIMADLIAKDRIEKMIEPLSPARFG